VTCNLANSLCDKIVGVMDTGAMVVVEEVGQEAVGWIEILLLMIKKCRANIVGLIF
jgi:hypothetical protein